MSPIKDKIKGVNSESISSLIKKMKEGTLCLPSFQRDFVWKPQQMALLIESLVRHYPIGTIICLRYIENKDLGKNSFVGTSPSAFNPKYYVIDGQQRLRTFYETLNIPRSFTPHPALESQGKKYKIYFKVDVNPRRLSTNVDKPTFVVTERAEEGDVEDYESQGRRKLIPMEFVLSEEHVKQWFATAFKNRSKAHSRYRENIAAVRKRISAYLCPVEYIIRRLSSRDHTNIFKLLNEGGTDLTSFDLISAHLNPYHLNLREMWKASDTEHGFSKEFNLDPIYLLKVLMLIRETKTRDEWPTCNKQDLKRIPQRYGIRPNSEQREKRTFQKEFREDWLQACRYTKKALVNMRWDFGAHQKKHIPYTTIIIPMAAILWWIDSMDYAQRYKGGLKDKIKNWYWGAIFARSYEKRTDGVASDHYNCLREYLKIGNRKHIPSDIKFWKSKSEIEGAIDSLESSGDARYKAILCLPLINGAEDLYSHEYLLGANLNDHHIYPKKCAEVQDEEEIDINQVSNRMLITDKTNQAIKNKSPYVYLGEKACKKRLPKYFLWSEIYKDKLPYKKFIEERKRRIIIQLDKLINN